MRFLARRGRIRKNVQSTRKNAEKEPKISRVAKNPEVILIDKESEIRLVDKASETIQVDNESEISQVDKEPEINQVDEEVSMNLVAYANKYPNRFVRHYYLLDRKPCPEKMPNVVILPNLEDAITIIEFASRVKGLYRDFVRSRSTKEWAVIIGWNAEKVQRATQDYANGISAQINTETKDASSLPNINEMPNIRTRNHNESRRNVFRNTNFHYNEGISIRQNKLDDTSESNDDIYANIRQIARKTISRILTEESDSYSDNSHRQNENEKTKTPMDENNSSRAGDIKMNYYETDDSIVEKQIKGVNRLAKRRSHGSTSIKAKGKDVSIMKVDRKVMNSKGSHPKKSLIARWYPRKRSQVRQHYMKI